MVETALRNFCVVMVHRRQQEDPGLQVRQGVPLRSNAQEVEILQMLTKH